MSLTITSKSRSSDCSTTWVATNTNFGGRSCRQALLVWRPEPPQAVRLDALLAVLLEKRGVEQPEFFPGWNASRSAWYVSCARATALDR